MRFQKAENTAFSCLKKMWTLCEEPFSQDNNKDPLRNVSSSPKLIGSNKNFPELIQGSVFPRTVANTLANPSVSGEWPRLCHSPLAGFTHALISVYNSPIQSGLSGTLAVVCVSLLELNPPLILCFLPRKTRELHVCGLCVIFRCHAFHCFKSGSEPWWFGDWWRCSFFFPCVPCAEWAEAGLSSCWWPVYQQSEYLPEQAEPYFEKVRPPCKTSKPGLGRKWTLA